MMPFIGVRISWLMLATKSLLARDAASAASLARCSTISPCLRSVMSRPTAWMASPPSCSGRVVISTVSVLPSGVSSSTSKVSGPSARSERVTRSATWPARVGGASSASWRPTTSCRRRPIIRWPARLKLVSVPVASQVQIRSLACSISSSCCRVSSASCSRLRASRASDVRRWRQRCAAQASAPRRPSASADAGGERRAATGSTGWRRRGRRRHRAPTGARRADAAAVGEHAVDALGNAGQLDAAARGDRERPAVLERHDGRQHDVVVDEREALLLALHVALDDVGRGPGQAAGGVVAQQMGDRPRHGFQRRGGAPVARSRA